MDAFGDAPADEHEAILRGALGLLHRLPRGRPVRLAGLRASNFG